MTRWIGHRSCRACCWPSAHRRPAARPDRRPGRPARSHVTVDGTVSGRRRFDELIAEGDAVPVAGWDFSWFDGRAIEERPRWGYARLLSERIGRARAVLDIQTGGGEVLAEAVRCSGAPVGQPQRLAATESWPPNLALARRALAPLGGMVVGSADEADLPFGDGSFDLVVSRHPHCRRVARDRAGARAGRRLPLPADRAWVQPRALRLHDGTAAGGYRPQSAGRGGGSGNCRP